MWSLCSIVIRPINGHWLEPIVKLQASTRCPVSFTVVKTLLNVLLKKSVNLENSLDMVSLYEEDDDQPDMK